MMGDFPVFHALDCREEPEKAMSPSSCEVTPLEPKDAGARFDDPDDHDNGGPRAVAACTVTPSRHPYAGKEQLEALLSAIALGDEAAFEGLYRLTSRRLFAILIRMVHDHAEAEELLQDTYTIAWHRAASFDGSRGSAFTWLAALARNRAIDRMRRHREHPLDDALLRGIPDCAPTPDASAEARERRARLEEGLRHLSAQQHCAIKSAFFGELTYNELATVLGVPQGTVKSWIRRGLAHLRVYMEP